MGALHQLFVGLFDEDRRLLPGASEFAHRYRRNRVDSRSGIFEFTRSDEMIGARLEARQRGLEAESYYAFRVGAGEIARYPGYYLSPVVVEPLAAGEVADLKSVQIAKDSESESIWVREDVKCLIEPLQRDVQMSLRPELHGHAWYAIEDLAELPEPIIVVETRFANPNIGPSLGTYAVQSDGRDVLSPANVDGLRSSGLRKCTRIATPEADYRIRPRYVASAEIMQSLIDSGVRGLSKELFPLLEMDDPVVELVASHE